MPGTDVGSTPAPTGAPIEFADDGLFRHDGYWNSFQFHPPLTHEDALVILKRAEALGYRMLFRRADYSLEEVQAQLVEKGPSAFLNLTWLQEDISPKEPPPTAEQRMAARLRSLAPAAELIITDPYLFTRSRNGDATPYAQSVGRMMAPALTAGLHIIAVVDPRQSDLQVQAAVEAELHTRRQGLNITVLESTDFHDRFWIADRTRGLIIGTSLNKIGGKIFFVDKLSESDVTAVLLELGQVSGF